MGSFVQDKINDFKNYALTLILGLLFFNSCNTIAEVNQVNGTYLGEAIITTWGYSEKYDSVGTFIKYEILKDTTIIQNYIVELIQGTGTAFFINEEIIIHELDSLLFEYNENNNYKFLEDFDGHNSKRVCFNTENEMLIYEFRKNSQYANTPSNGKSIKYIGIQN